MARRSEHTQDEIKQMVLQAAERIVIEQGLDSLSARAIALDIGYTVGSIYKVFDNMADLILHLKTRTLDDIALTLQQALVVDDSPQCCLVALSKAYLTYAKHNFNRWQMLFNQRQTAALVTPDWYKLQTAQLFKLIEGQLKRHTPMASDEQAHRAAQALWGGVNGICYSAVLEDVSDTERTVGLLVESFMRGWMLEER
ncbi:MAG: TetR/AcrR family transcriptional regulator [Methylococcaceae bacterium]|nr:TetR/AcrR family transcriptional regulator [Methylococcaceae bacterium]